MIPDESQLKKLTELTKGDSTIAEERQEDLLHLGIATLAAFSYVPLHASSKSQTQKFKLSKYLSQRLIEPENIKFTENWLLFLRHPTSSINVLKSLYSFCMADLNMCIYLSKNLMHMNTICDIITEKVN
jgi:hypothetical protein